MAHKLKLLFLKSNDRANIFSVKFNFNCTQKSDAVPSLVKKLLSILSQLTLMLFQLQHRAELLKILFANGHHKTELETGVRSLINLEVALGFTVG